MTKVKVILLLLLHFSPCFGDLNKELNSFFDKFGSSVGVSSADIYDGQKAGYATGGGTIIRNRVMNSKLLTVNLPKFDAGCGGIDIFAGGFSFINNDQLVNTLKGIGSSAIGYAFLLGLETVSPQVANTIKQLQSWSNTINSLNINSCETASQLVGSVWPRKTMASQQICRTAGSKKGLFSDYVSARHRCSQDGEYEDTMNRVSSDAEFRDVLTDQYNIAWEAIKKQEILSQSRELSEFMMSLMGTIIVRKDGGIDIESWPTKINNEDFLKVLLEGGTATIYGCENLKDEKCLWIKEREITVTESQAWVGKVRNQLTEMQNRILGDEELYDSEKELLNKTRLPLYKIVNVMTAYKKGHCPIDLYQVAELVAMDLLIQYIREAIQLVREGASQLRRGQMYADPLDEYLEDLRRVEKSVKYYEMRSKHLMELDFQLVQKLQLIEDQLAMEIRL